MIVGIYVKEVNYLKVICLRLLTFVIAFMGVFFATSFCQAYHVDVPTGTFTASSGSISSSRLYLMPAPGPHAVLRLDSAGVLGPDVTIEGYVALSGGGNSGFIYRTSYYGPMNDTFGWYVGISYGGVQIGYGTNSQHSAWTSVASAQVDVVPNKYYKLKVVAHENNHKVYLDGKPVLDIDHDIYSDVSGYVGLRSFNQPASFKNVNVE